MSKENLYLSIDIECDGPCPGLNSMLSLGLAGFTTNNKIVFEWEKNYFPLDGATVNADTQKFWMLPENKEAYEYVISNRVDPKESMIELDKEIKKLKKNYNIFVVGYPINFDWQYINYYFHRFTGGNPLGFSARCISTYAWCLSKFYEPNNKQINIDKWKDPNFPHTHKALDDAKEQGKMFINMLHENVMNNLKEQDVKIFISYKFSGIPHDTLHSLIDPIVNNLSSKYEVYCNLNDESYYVENKMDVGQIMNHALGKMDDCNYQIIIHNGDSTSEGMIMEYGYGLKKNIKQLLLLKTGTYTSMQYLTKNVIEYTDNDDLMKKLMNFEFVL